MTSELHTIDGLIYVFEPGNIHLLTYRDLVFRDFATPPRVAAAITEEHIKAMWLRIAVSMAVSDEELIKGSAPHRIPRGIFNG